MEKIYTQEDMDKCFLGGKAVGKAEGHNKPSPETIKMIDNLNSKFDRLNEDITDIKIQNQKVSDNIDFIKEKFSQLPCKSEGERIDKVEIFQNNLKTKIGIITTISMFIGGVALWLSQEIIKKFWLR